MSYRYGPWKPYVPVAQRRAKAAQKLKQLQKKSGPMQPVAVAGSTIARSFWGKAWCAHLEKFSDFENRLPRGRSYVRTGAVCHLDTQAGRVDAKVIGSALYTVSAQIKPLKPAAWTTLKRQCAGEIGSLLDVLQGKLSERVMRVVTDRDHGLFPKPGEMTFACSCPDWAEMCKHVAATLYGIGNRLDQQPEMLFLLRGVDPAELIDAGLAAPRAATGPDQERLDDDQLGAIFGIEMDDAPPSAAAPKVAARSAQKPGSKRPPASKTRKAEFRATGNAIARLRKKLALSRNAFAERLSVSPASVQRWESLGSAPLTLHARCLAALTRLHRGARGNSGPKP